MNRVFMSEVAQTYNKETNFLKQTTLQVASDHTRYLQNSSGQELLTRLSSVCSSRKKIEGPAPTQISLFPTAVIHLTS